MHEIAVIGNPRGRKRDAKGRFLKRAKSAAQKRGAKARPAAAVKRGKGRANKPAKTVRRSTQIVTVRRYRSNPRAGFLDQVTAALLPSAIAAGGAIAVDVGLAYVPLPDRLKSGPMRHVTRALGAIALGAAAGFVVNPATAGQIMSGGLTVTFHQAAREALGKFAPKVRLAAIEDESLGAFESEVAALIEDERAMGALEFSTLNAVESPFVPALGQYDPESL